MSYKVAICSLNQWSLDFEGNTRRIIRSIELAKEIGAIYRAGPELELCGYSLEDAFFETDTIDHCWACLEEIMDFSLSVSMVIDVGMPVHFGSLYNCRVLIYQGNILCIRAKTSLAKEGNYREIRHFEPWPKSADVVPFKLPSMRNKNTIAYVPFGANFVLDISVKTAEFSSTSLRIGWDICQELWDLKNTSAEMYHDFGCHLVVNSSGSYWELRKLETVNDMIKGLTTRSGACYAFSNLIGCDGQRYIFYGRSCIYDGGRLVAMTSMEPGQIFDEVQMISYEINPRDIDVRRALLGIRPNLSNIKRVCIWNQTVYNATPDSIDGCRQIFHLEINRSDMEQSKEKLLGRYHSSKSIDINPKIRFEGEIYCFVSLWLWDYLRRSKMKGFMMPLSGGLDSSTVAVLVYSMCDHLTKCLLNNSCVRDYFTEVHKIPPESLTSQLKSPKAICKLLLKCSYISTRYSSEATQDRASRLSQAIGADYSDISIQDIYDKCRNVAYINEEQSNGVTLLEQNLQARLRMVMTYHMSGGNRIVLATGNVDEAIMGYLTKYDCSSADINPIGGLCKEDLKSYLDFCRKHLFTSNSDLVKVIGDIIDAPPSAELTGSDQRDEIEMGLTYDEISVLGKVRRGFYGCSGPMNAFEIVWRERNNPPFRDKIECLKDDTRNRHEVALELGELIKRFYRRYTRNRHKLTVLTPALHAETYSPDDNRFDHRQFLYPNMSYQFKCIDDIIARIK